MEAGYQVAVVYLDDQAAVSMAWRLPSKAMVAHLTIGMLDLKERSVIDCRCSISKTFPV